MSKAWPLVKLGEVLEKSQNWINLDGQAEYKEVTVRLWGKGVTLRGIVTGSQIAGSRRLQVHSNQFILSRIDARNGAFGLIPDELENAVVSNDFPVFEIHHNRLLPTYLHWLSKTRNFVESCKSVSEGTTNRVRLKEDKFIQIEIPLPPLAEQQRIVAKIERLAGKIEEINKLNQKIIEEADNVTISIHKKFSGTQKKMIGDILILEEDKELIKENGEYSQVGVKSFGGGLFPKLSIKGTETTYKNFNRLYNGAIVLSQVKGWEGAIAVCDKNLAGWYVSPEYRTFRCNPKEALPEYMATLVKTEWFWKHLKNATRGVGARRERTRPEQFLTIKIPMPDVKLQKIGQKLFAKIELSKHAKAQTIAELDALLPSILDRAFKGEL